MKRIRLATSGQKMNWSQEDQAYTIGIKDIWAGIGSIWAVERRRDENIARRGSLAVSNEDVQARWPEIRTLQTIQSVPTL